MAVVGGRRGHRDTRPVAIETELDGDTVALVIRMAGCQAPLLAYNVRLVTPDVPEAYARALVWAETRIVTCSDPLCWLRLADL